MTHTKLTSATRSVVESLARRAMVSGATQIALTFGDGGYVIGPAGSDTIYDMAEQADGKIVAAGMGTRPGSWDWDFQVQRYNPDGSLDTTFGHGDRAYSGAVLPSGKIRAAGEVDTRPDTNAYRETALACFNSDGSLDTTFGD